MASNKVSWMTPGAGNNIRPNRHQLASIKYENATKIDYYLVVLNSPRRGLVPLPVGGGPNSPWRGLVPLGSESGTAIMLWRTVGGLQI